MLWDLLKQYLNPKGTLVEMCSGQTTVYLFLATPEPQKQLLTWLESPGYQWEWIFFLLLKVVWKTPHSSFPPEYFLLIFLWRTKYWSFWHTNCAFKKNAAFTNHQIAQKWPRAALFLQRPRGFSILMCTSARASEHPPCVKSAAWLHLQG